jgi:hypothetical protein
MTGCLKWVVILALLPLAAVTLFWIGVAVLAFIGVMLA